MLKKLLLPSVAAMVLAAPAASADVTPAGDVLYVMGGMNGWDINNTNAVLPRVADNVYKGVVRTDGDVELRFYTVLGDWESNSIGVVEEDSQQMFDFSGGNVATDFVEGKGNWYLFNQAPGLMEVTVNFNDNSVFFEKLHPESVTVKSDQELTLTDGSFSFDGDAEVLFEVSFSNGSTCTLGGERWYDMEGNVVDNKQYMDESSKSMAFYGRPTDVPVVVMGCKADDPVNYTVNFEEMTVSLKRSSFDPTVLTFELNENESPLIVGDGYNIGQFLNVDSQLSWNDIYLEIVSGNAEQWDSQNFMPTEAGELTLAFYSNEIPDKRLEKTFTVLPQHPEAYNLYVRTGEWEYAIADIVLAKDAEKNGMYLATVTIPEGEGDFEFIFGGTEELMNQGIYQISRSWESPEQMNLNEEIARSRFERGSTGLFFNIPAEFRGQTYVFRLNIGEWNLEVYREGYNPDLVNIVPAESNPEYAVKGRNTEFRFAVDRNLNYDSVLEGSDYMWNSGWGTEYVDDQLYYYINVYCQEDMPEDEFTLIIGKRDDNGEFTELYRQTIAAAFVELEAVELPEEVTVCVGEFVKIQPVTVPENASTGFGWDSDNWNGYVEDYFGNDVTILGMQEGVVNYVVRDHTNGNELAHMTVTVLPKQAAVAEHIFHVRLNEGDNLNLNLSAHATRDYAPASWTSSNEEVATVDSEGNVTAVGNGTAVITADCGEHQAVMGIQVGDISGVEETAAVNVKAYGHDGAIYVSGVKAGQAIKVYDVEGRMVGNATSNGSVAKFEVGKGVHVVAAGDNVFKLGL